MEYRAITCLDLQLLIVETHIVKGGKESFMAKNGSSFSELCQRRYAKSPGETSSPYAPLTKFGRSHHRGLNGCEAHFVRKAVLARHPSQQETCRLGAMSASLDCAFTDLHRI